MSVHQTFQPVTEMGDLEKFIGEVLIWVCMVK
jgi:hypothetical protein